MKIEFVKVTETEDLPMVNHYVFDTYDELKSFVKNEPEYSANISYYIPTEGWALIA